MYAIVNRKIERLSEIIHIAVVNFTLPGILIPAIVITIVNYFDNHLGSESFYLPVLVMYVTLCILIKNLLNNNCILCSL